MKPHAKASLPGLFDFMEPAPLSAGGESREEFERNRFGQTGEKHRAKAAAQPTADVSKYRYARVPGHCIKELRFWTGNIAVKVGPVEIERAPKMIYILVNGRMGYTFSTEHAPDLDKFNQHFRFDEATCSEGGAA
jgi:hypothetical protein